MAKRKIMQMVILHHDEVDAFVRNLRDQVKREMNCTDEGIAEAIGCSLGTIRCRSSKGELDKTSTYDTFAMAKMLGKKVVLVDD